MEANERGSESDSVPYLADGLGQNTGFYLASVSPLCVGIMKHVAHFRGFLRKVMHVVWAQWHSNPLINLGFYF